MIMVKMGNDSGDKDAGGDGYITHSWLDKDENGDDDDDSG